MITEIPMNITHKEFFLDFIIKQHELLKTKIIPLNLEFEIGIEISGSNGADYSIIYNNGNLKTQRGTADSPLFTLSFDNNEWNKFLELKLYNIFIDVDKLNKIHSKVLITQPKVDKLKNEHSFLVFKLNDVLINNINQSFDFSINIGQPIETDPKITFNLSQKDIDLIKEQKSNLQSLIMGKKINVQGDVMFLVKLATIVLL